MSGSLQAGIIRAAAGHNLAESALSFLCGSWLWAGLVREATDFQGPGRNAGGPLALSFDVDFREDVDAINGLLELLAKLDLKASFACVGYWVERFPAEHRAIVAAGHEIVNHTQTHPDNEEIDPHRHFHQLSPSELINQIVEAHQVIEKHLQVSPVGFRAPHFGYQHTEEVYPIIAEMGYRYSSSTIASRSPSWGWPHPTPGGELWELPVTVCPAHPFSSFDTWHFIRKQPSRHRPGQFIQALEMVIARFANQGLPLAVYFDPRDAAASGECRRAVELFARAEQRVTTFGGWVAELGPLSEAEA